MRRDGAWQGIFRGVLVSVAVTVVLVAVFALLISLFRFSDGTIHLLNQLIKLAAIFAGVWAAVKPGFCAARRWALCTWRRAYWYMPC